MLRIVWQWGDCCASYPLTAEVQQIPPEYVTLGGHRIDTESEMASAIGGLVL